MEGKEKNKVNDMLIDIDLIDRHLAENTKKILKDVAKNEFGSFITKALNEDFDEEDVEDEVEGGEGSADDIAPEPAGDMGADAGVDAEPEVGADGGEGEDMGDMGGEDPLAGLDGVPGDEEVMDLTGSDDDMVMSVFKELADGDEVEVIGDEIHINVTQPGKYIIKPNKGGMSAEESVSDFEVDLEDGGDMGDEEEIEFDENVVYEIVMNGLNEEGAHDEHMKETPAPNTGDIDGQKSPVDPDIKDNDKGGFDVKKTGGDAHGDHVMESEGAADGEEMEMSEDWVTEEDVQGENAIEEHIPKGKGEAKRVPGKADIGQPRGAGAKADIKESSKESQYEKLLKEANELKAENEAFKKNLSEVGKRLHETALFSTNLANVVKILMENSTTKDEKETIVRRFDEEVRSLKESNILYKKIVNELNSRTSLSEGVISKVDKNMTSGISNLNEQTAYVDPATARIRELMGQVDRVGK